MHNATLVTVLRKERRRNVILVRKNPKTGRKKQCSNEHYAKDLQWLA
jgi:hypothetical protein